MWKRSVVAAWFLAAACADDSTNLPGVGSPGVGIGEAVGSVETVQSEGPLVVFLGDSLTAGYGLSEGEAFPRLLATRLAAAGWPIRLVNAGVSGDTSAGGLRRLDWLLDQRPAVVVVELGANDGLRGLPLEATRSSLESILRRSRDAGCAVLLLGMRLPPNYGPNYSEGFRSIFVELAEELGVPLVPFLLAGVGGQPELNLEDGIHPTAAGHARLSDNVYPYLLEILVRSGHAG